jgi:hypothetical protein
MVIGLLRYILALTAMRTSMLHADRRWCADGLLRVPFAAVTAGWSMPNAVDPLYRARASAHPGWPTCLQPAGAKIRSPA